MAVGASRMFGIVLAVNFHSPYKATNIIEFWRRWHMTLSAFLRDYLYIALGGNRAGRLMRYRNFMLTMLLGGLMKSSPRPDLTGYRSPGRARDHRALSSLRQGFSRK